MNFQAKDKIKRVKIAKELHSKGFSIKKLAEYFDVSEDTASEYLKYDIQGKEDKEIIVKKETPNITLSDFASNTTTVDKVLPKNIPQGDRCPLCNKYHKYELMIAWNDKIRICKKCYNSMDSEKMDKLERLQNINS